MTSLLRWTHKLCRACFGTAILGKQNKIYFSLLFSSVQSSILQFCKRGFRHFFVSSLLFFSVSILARFLLYCPEKHICILLPLEFFWELVFYVLTRPCFGIPEMGGCILQRPRKNLADGSFFLKNIVFRYTTVTLSTTVTLIERTCTEVAQYYCKAAVQDYFSYLVAFLEITDWALLPTTCFYFGDGSACCILQKDAGSMLHPCWRMQVWFY